MFWFVWFFKNLQHLTVNLWCQLLGLEQLEIKPWNSRMEILQRFRCMTSLHWICLQDNFTAFCFLLQQAIICYQTKGKIGNPKVVSHFFVKGKAPYLKPSWGWGDGVEGVNRRDRRLPPLHRKLSIGWHVSSANIGIRNNYSFH